MIDENHVVLGSQSNNALEPILQQSRIKGRVEREDGLVEVKNGITGSACDQINGTVGALRQVGWLRIRVQLVLYASK
jgi:hypothetical protein